MEGSPNCLSREIDLLLQHKIDLLLQRCLQLPPSDLFLKSFGAMRSLRLAHSTVILICPINSSCSSPAPPPTSTSPVLLLRWRHRCRISELVRPSPLVSCFLFHQHLLLFDFFVLYIQRISIGYIVAALCEIWLLCQRWRGVGFFRRYYWQCDNLVEEAKGINSLSPQD
ncbi:uncharacterized protein LOC114281311 [Camellia sinensis]|uniref:uncharacterized protein LOC114281311 n=1 Tax=Camellia sinensis TaxID=4442 RepID=UPI0010358B34|nr:uncharacterized protein LOC114281311 [Camellia sinensis]